MADKFIEQKLDFAALAKAYPSTFAAFVAFIAKVGEVKELNGWEVINSLNEPAIQGYLLGYFDSQHLVIIPQPGYGFWFYTIEQYLTPDVDARGDIFQYGAIEQSLEGDIKRYTSRNHAINAGAIKCFEVLEERLKSI